MSPSLDGVFVPPLAIAAGLLFGASDLIATLYARRHGTPAIAAAVSVASTIVLIVLAAPELLESPSLAQSLWLPGLLGIGGGAGYALLLEAYRRGPIAAVAPVASSIGAVSLLLALAVHGGSPSSQDYVGLLLVTFGAVLGATSAGATGYAVAGPAFAALGVLCTAAAVVGLEGPIRELGALPVLAAWRIGHSAAIVLVALTAGSGAGSFRRRLRLLPVGALAVIGAGILDGSGQVARGFALSIGPTWLIVALAASGPIVVTTGARAFFREAVRARQVIGLASVIVGSVTLAS